MPFTVFSSSSGSNPLSGQLFPVATLANLPVSAPNGMSVYVQSKHRDYEFINGTWYSTNRTDPSLASATDWYIDNVSGSDENIGTDPAFPLQTIAEWSARMGQTPLTTSPVLHIVGNLTEDAPIFSFVQGVGCFGITVTGDPIVTIDTTISAVTPWDQQAGVVGTIKGTASLAGTGGSIYRIVGGARDGALGVIVANEGGGGDVMVTPAAFGLWAPSLGDDLHVGDRIQILSLPTWANNVTVTGNCYVFFSYLHFTSVDSHGIEAMNQAQLWLSACTIDAGCDSNTGCFLSQIGCNSSAATSTCRSEGQESYAEQFNSYVSTGTVRINTTFATGENVIKGYYTVNTQGFLQLGGANWFEATIGQYCINILENATFYAPNYAIGGRNNNIGGGSARIVIHNGGSMDYDIVPTIAGTGNDLLIGGTAKAFSDANFVNTTNLARYNSRT